MKTVYKCSVDADLAGRVEKAFYRWTSRKNLLMSMMRDTTTRQDVLERYDNMTTDAFMEYDSAKAELMKTYMPELMHDGRISWSLNFREKTLTITCAGVLENVPEGFVAVTA